MATRQRSSDDTRPDAWAKQLSTMLAEEADRDGQPRDGANVLVVGGGWFGRRLAGQLADDLRVHHLDTDPEVVTDTESHEASHVSDLTTPGAFTANGVVDGAVAIVATGRDARNLLVTQHLRTRFGFEHVLVVLEDPRNRDACDVPGVKVICAQRTVSEAVHSVLLEAVEPVSREAT